MFDSCGSDDVTSSVDQHGARAAGAHIYPDQVHRFGFVGTFLTQIYFEITPQAMRAPEFPDGSVFMSSAFS